MVVVRGSRHVYIDVADASCKANSSWACHGNHKGPHFVGTNRTTLPGVLSAQRKTPYCQPHLDTVYLQTKAVLVCPLSLSLSIYNTTFVNTIQLRTRPGLTDSIPPMPSSDPRSSSSFFFHIRGLRACPEQEYSMVYPVFSETFMSVLIVVWHEIKSLEVGRWVCCF